jgi:hypothetical protein
MRYQACAAVLLSACGSRAPLAQAPEPHGQNPAQPGDLVVASGPGAPIFASQIAAHARATGLAPRAALDDLVRQELLAREAWRRGYDREPAVQLARREEMVRLFVARDFGAQHADPSVIPDSDLRPVYDQRIEYFKHERLARVWNVCTTALQAKALYDDARAHPPQTNQAFAHIANAHGSAAQEILVEETSRAYHEQWRKALFASIKKRGDLMPPAHLPELPFPCSDHVAWAEEFFAPRDDSFEQARKELREKIWEDWRKNAFAKWVAEWVQKHQIATHPEQLPNE